MRSRLRFMLMLLLMIEMLPPASAQSPSPSTSEGLSTPLPSPTSSPQRSITAVLSREKSGEAVTSFTTETPNIYLLWQSQNLSASEKVRCIWIAEDVGNAAPANYHVDEAVTTANESQTHGVFTLSKPKADWPEGKYRVEIYVGTKLMETLPFTIEKARGD